MKNEVIIGDCVEVLKQFDDESIDCIVTDPPYGYSFMGLEWDKALPSLDALNECQRVLKSGAFGFFMCAPRQDVLSRMIIRLEEAGFRVDFSFIGWSYASGFPKATNASKAVDKKLGAKREKIKKEYSGNTFYRMEGQNTRPWMEEALKVGYHLSDSNTPITQEAQCLDGAYLGFQPKPALECIITVMKPLSEKTYVDQALNNGKGVTWLGNCKIPCEPPHHDDAGRTSGNGFTKQGGSVYHTDPNGRFPANLLVSDDVLNNGVITKSTGGPANLEKLGSSDIYKYTDHKRGFHPGDSGSFSRYFSLDAWFNKKIQELPEEQQKTFPFLIVPKPSKSEKNKYIENKHPTVKPLKLMSYLITLGSREGDVVLDPFAGSGTTLEACKLLNRVFIGIDKDPENEKYMVARGQLNTCTLNNFEEVV